MKKLPIIAFALLMFACTTLDPNLHEESARIALQNGQCDQVRKLVTPAADRGEPWAQYRLAAVLIECQPIDAQTAIEWMRRVASYPVKTPWELGLEAAKGPVGYFDARDPVARANLFLVTFDLAKGKNKEVWLRLAKAQRYFSPSEPLFEKIANAMSGIEKNIPQRTLELWRSELPAGLN